MCTRKLLFICALIPVISQGNGVDAQDLVESKKLSDNVIALLEHFKQPDPVGLPEEIIPDPYPIPDMQQSVTMGKLYFKNASVYGISKFRIVYLNAEIRRMEVFAALSIDKLEARGNYTLSSWFDTKHGPFTVNIKNLNITAKAAIGVQRKGKLRAGDIAIDLGFDTVAADFVDLGVLGEMFQSVINNGGTFIFDAIKPYVLKEAYSRARIEINSKLDEFTGDLQFPNSISPLDMMLINIRKKIRKMSLDPFQIKNFNTTANFITVKLYNTWLNGISSFQRVGNITFKIENRTAFIAFEVGTQKLEGSTHWAVSAIGDFVSKSGKAWFSIDYINVQIILAQPLDVREKVALRNLDIDIGNIQIRSNGFGTIDYFIEFAVNVLPNLLRYQILDAIEKPLKIRAQQELNCINIEEIIKNELAPKLDEMQELDLKLSSLVRLDELEEQISDKDDKFFNF